MLSFPRCHLNTTYFVASWSEQQCCRPWTYSLLQYLEVVELLSEKNQYGKNRVEIIPNFLMADINFLSSFTFCTLTCFFFLLWVPIGKLRIRVIDYLCLRFGRHYWNEQRAWLWRLKLLNPSSLWVGLLYIY